MRRITSTARWALAVAGLGSAVTSSGCDDTSGEADGAALGAACDEAGEVDCLEMAEGALVLDPEEDGQNGITGVSLVDASTLDFKGTGPVVSRLAPGMAFMRGVRGHGLVLGRVTEVSTTTEGAKRVRFERARIQDVIPRARIRAKKRVTCDAAESGAELLSCRMSDVGGPPLAGQPAANGSALSIEVHEGALGVSNCARTLWSDSGGSGSSSWEGSLELTSCHFTVEFDVDIDISWGFVLPDAFATSITMTTDAGLALLGDFSAGYSTEDEVKLVGLGPLSFTVLGVPMYVSGAIYAGYSLDMEAEAHFEAGYEYDATETFGFGWAKGDGVYSIRDSVRDVARTGPTYTTDGTVGAQAWLKPEVEAGIGYDGFLAAGLTLGLEAGARFDAEIHTRNLDAEVCASLDLYATPQLGYDLDIFGLVDKRDSFALSDWSRNLFDVCIATDEMENPACESGGCNSAADCHWRAVAGPGGAGQTAVAGAPRERLTADDRVCVVGACEATGSVCGCAYAWVEGCCTQGGDCGVNGTCMQATNRCLASLVPGDADAAPGSLGRDACDEAADCDDERPLTTDTCEAGDCVHAFAGATRPGVFGCARDNECTEGRFCHGGKCQARLPTPACAEMTCNDGDVRTLDACQAGDCTHTSVSTLSAP
jgi:hypothetical protein